MENRLLKSYFWLSYSFIQVLYIANNFADIGITVAICTDETKEIKEYITVEKNAQIGKTVYKNNVPLGLRYNASLSSNSSYFEVINDDSQVQIEVSSALHSGLNDSLTIVYTSSGIDCRSSIVFTIILTVKRITTMRPTRLPLNVSVFKCDPETAVDVHNVTCDSHSFTTCRPISCDLQNNDIFRLSAETRIQANVDNLNFSHTYELLADCEAVIEKNGSVIDYMVRELEFDVTFHDFCGLVDVTFSPIHHTESATSGLMLSSSSATVAIPTTTVSAGQNKSNTTALITRSGSPADGTGCKPANSNSEGFVVSPTMVVVLAMLAVIICVSTAVGCYCLGYKRCVPLPMALGGIKDEDNDDVGHNDATTA